MAFRSKPGAIQFITGGFLCIVAFVAILSFPKLYKVELQHEITLMNNTLLFDIWKDFPIPIYQKFYFFNITNSEHYLNNSDEKMIVQEVWTLHVFSRWVKGEHHMGRWHDYLQRSEDFPFRAGTIRKDLKMISYVQLTDLMQLQLTWWARKESYVQNLVNIEFTNLDLENYH
ncbi:scavenger receptor class B member 1 [Caerostris extrusa]|uniref:Scavenger receptor class B member 1 n=1 Tax=Caerostris extrusa TaxID=172846 RepID=A0AAV4UK86_CAEEX|nr:scavenger receptor class B member 1 [Caerostris extrusa]